MLEKTIRFVLGKGVKIKTLGASRTDAMVSANEFPCELFLEMPIPKDFIGLMNINLPSDIELLSVREIDANFNVIQDVASKEYVYQLVYNEKLPFESHRTAFVPGELDIDAIKLAAPAFQGTHNFNAFTYPYEPEGTKIRSIEEIIVDTTGNYITFKVVGKGFMRYQIRLMIGALIEVGRHRVSSDQIVESLKSGEDTAGYNKAPASGLILNKVWYGDSMN